LTEIDGEGCHYVLHPKGSDISHSREVVQWLSFDMYTRTSHLHYHLKICLLNAMITSKKFTTLNQQNGQTCSLDIHITIAHWIFLHILGL